MVTKPALAVMVGIGGGAQVAGATGVGLHVCEYVVQVAVTLIAPALGVPPEYGN
jgi:hypothetical protein